MVVKHPPTEESAESEACIDVHMGVVLRRGHWTHHGKFADSSLTVTVAVKHAEGLGGIQVV